MKITLVRHAETEENYDGKLQGRRNILLNDTGRRQCKRLRERINDKKYDYCYMSPLVRCVETAMILIGDRVEMIPDKRLIERDIGEFEGKDKDLYDIESYWDVDTNKSEDGVEPVSDLIARCQDFINYICDKHKDGNILIVTHNAPYRVLRHILLKHELSGNLFDNYIVNCQIEEFDFN